MENTILDDEFQYESRTFDTRTVKEINLLKIDAHEQIATIKSGRSALFVLSGLTLLGIFLGIYMNPYGATITEIILEGIILIVIYIACAFWTTRNAKASFIVAIAIYSLCILLGMYLDPGSIFSGIIIKAAVFYYLINALQAAFKIDKILAKLSILGVSGDDIAQAKKLIELPKTEYTDSV